MLPLFVQRVGLLVVDEAQMVERLPAGVQRSGRGRRCPISCGSGMRGELKT
jgi:hypothetical protein